MNKKIFIYYRSLYDCLFSFFCLNLKFLAFTTLQFLHGAMCTNVVKVTKKLQKFFNLSQNFQTALNVLSVTFTLFAITHIILSSFHS